jgi:hypothetical protein
LELLFLLLQLVCVAFFLYAVIYFIARHALNHSSFEYYSNQMPQVLNNRNNELKSGEQYERQQILMKKEYSAKERIDT